MRLSRKIALSCNSLKVFRPKTALIPAECNPSQYQELNESTRYWKHSKGKLLCDDHIASGQWYRFTGAAGTMMATYCIPKKSCKTYFVGWINGNHPSEAYQLVSATTCFHWRLDCCAWSRSIRIRNCSGYYIYEFEKMKGCPFRYCGVNGLYLYVYVSCITSVFSLEPT